MNTAIAQRTTLRKRCVPRRSSRQTRPRVQIPSLWCLPDELLLQLIRDLHIKDLLSVRSSHPYLRDLIDTHSSSVWGSISFQDVWPTQANLRHFEKAAEYGNMQSLVKLGIAYLYNEGLPGDFEGKKITRNGEQAATKFCRVECLTPVSTAPFSWLFIRPPWALAGACCKECVFNNMKEFVDSQPYNCESVHVCIAKTLQLLDDESREEEMLGHLRKAVEQNSPEAAFLLWQHTYGNVVLDRCVELQSLRELREVAKLGFVEAELTLCRNYAQGRYGGISRLQAASFVRDFIKNSRPSHVDRIYVSQQLTHSMRYILVDWLVEVANMKSFSSLTLHVAIDVVDRYLKARRTPRSILQLLGVAAMVLCSRFLGKDIITIREAAWLTDNTYKYEDVVRMMGEITATLRGKFRCVTSLDYVCLVGTVAQNDEVTQCVAEYVCELALLQSDLSVYPQAKLAAACVLLARLAQKKETPWPSCIVDFTGFSLADLAQTTSHLHHKCYVECCMCDHRNMELQAVKMRYSEQELRTVSKLPMLKKPELNELLGLRPRPVFCGDLQHDATAQSAAGSSSPHLIMSPSRKSTRDVSVRPEEMSKEREKAATPTLDKSFSDAFPGLNDSAMSGYDGDESLLDISYYESDADLESLWCAADHHSPMEVTAEADSGMDQPEGFSFLNFTSKSTPTSTAPAATSASVAPPLRASTPAASSTPAKSSANSSVFSLSALQSGVFISSDGTPTGLRGMQQSKVTRTSPNQDSGVEMLSTPKSHKKSAQEVKTTPTGRPSVVVVKHEQSQVNTSSPNRQPMQCSRGLSERNMNIPSPKPAQVKRKNTQPLGNESKTRVTQQSTM